MRQSAFDAPGNDPRAQRVIRAVERFIKHLRARAPSEHAAEVIRGDTVLRGTKVDQAPERFTVEHLVTGIAEALGYEYRPQPKGIDGIERKVPDFEVLNVSGVVLGETKTLNRTEAARGEAFDYLSGATERPAAGIATDGRTWILHTAAGERSEPTYDCKCSLRGVMEKVWTETSESSNRAKRSGLREDAERFVSEFSVDALETKLQVEG